MRLEPMVEGLALVAGMTWQFHTVHRMARTERDRIRFTIAAVAVAFVTALVLEYVRFRLPAGSAHVVIDLASALLLLAAGVAWLRRAILFSAGIRLSPALPGVARPCRSAGAPLASGFIDQHPSRTLPMQMASHWPHGRASCRGVK